MRLSLAVMLILLTGVATSHAADQVLTLDDLIVATRASRENLLSVDISFTWKTSGLPNAPEGLIPFGRQRVVYDLPTDRYLIDGAVEDPKLGVLLEASEAYDGKVLTSYAERGKHGKIKELASAPADTRAKMQPLFEGLMFRPMPDGSGLDDGSLVSLLAKGKLRSGQEKIAGRDCYVVDLVINMHTAATVWIDFERGAMPIKQISYGPDASGQPRQIGEHTITEAKAFHDDSGREVWLPTRIESSNVFCRSTIEVDGTKTKVNVKVEPTLFRVPFPQGARIFDAASGTAFVKDPGRPSMRDSSATTKHTTTNETKVK